MKVYHGKTQPGSKCHGSVYVHEKQESGENRALHILSPAISQKICNHSPDGFSWGYSGSGAAQLALAILYDVSHDKKLSSDYHQEFKEIYVSVLDEEFEIDESTVVRFLKEVQERDSNAIDTLFS